MLQEAMKTLEDAEAKAAEIVKEAGKKAEAIQAEAKEKANAMIVDEMQVLKQIWRLSRSTRRNWKLILQKKL